MFRKFPTLLKCFSKANLIQKSQHFFTFLCTLSHSFYIPLHSFKLLYTPLHSFTLHSMFEKVFSNASDLLKF